MGTSTSQELTEQNKTVAMPPKTVVKIKMLRRINSISVF